MASNSALAALVVLLGLSGGGAVAQGGRETRERLDPPTRARTPPSAEGSAGAAIRPGVGGQGDASPPEPIGPAPASPHFQRASNGLRYRAIHVPGAHETLVLCALAVGAEHDPAGESGRAAVLARLIGRRDADREMADRLHVGIYGRFTVISGRAVDAEAVAPLLARFRSLFDGSWTESLSDDEIELAAGDALLRADDALEVFPGEMLGARARGALFGRRPWGGVPEEIDALTPTGLRRALTDHYRCGNAVLAVFGPQPREPAEAMLVESFGKLPKGRPAVRRPAAERSSTASMEWTSERVQDPYVALAWRAPAADSPDLPPFLVAMELLGGWMVRSAMVQGGERRREREQRARLQPYVYRYAFGDRLVRIQRRTPLGGDVATQRRELADLVERMRKAVPDPRSAVLASAQVALQFQHPPYLSKSLRAMAHHGAVAMYPSARALVVGELVGWPPDLSNRIGKVSLGSIHEALRKHLKSEELATLSVVPTPK